MVVVSLAEPDFAPVEGASGHCWNDRSGQTRKQETEAGHVANGTVSVLFIAATVAHASVNVALASLPARVKLRAPAPGAAGSDEKCR
jgi:hypothetical protein